MATAELIDSRIGDVTPAAMIDGQIALDLPADLRIEDWQVLGRKLCAMDRCISWWLADWWAFGDAKYGARARMVRDGIFGAKYQRLADMGMVARKFDPSCRQEQLSFTHHQEVACLPTEQAQAVLEQASANGWSVRDTRNEVLRRKIGIAPVPVTPTVPLEHPSTPAVVDRIVRRTNRIVLAAFCDWFGVGEEYGRVLMALYQAGGQSLTWMDLSRAVSTHAPMARGAVHEAVSSLRKVFDVEAIDTDDNGYSLTEIGFGECRRAFRELGLQLIGMGQEPANDLSPLSAEHKAQE